MDSRKGAKTGWLQGWRGEWAGVNGEVAASLWLQGHVGTAKGVAWPKATNLASAAACFSSTLRLVAASLFMSLLWARPLILSTLTWIFLISSSLQFWFLMVLPCLNFHFFTFEPGHILGLLCLLPCFIKINGPYVLAGFTRVINDHNWRQAINKKYWFMNRLKWEAIDILERVGEPEKC